MRLHLPILQEVSEATAKMPNSSLNFALSVQSSRCHIPPIVRESAVLPPSPNINPKPPPPLGMAEFKKSYYLSPLVSTSPSSGSNMTLSRVRSEPTFRTNNAGNIDRGWDDFSAVSPLLRGRVRPSYYGSGVSATSHQASVAGVRRAPPSGSMASCLNDDVVVEKRFGSREGRASELLNKKRQVRKGTL
jgi:hypothetical protein